MTLQLFDAEPVQRLLEGLTFRAYSIRIPRSSQISERHVVRQSREDDNHGRQQDDGANVKQGWLYRRARPERRLDPGGAASLRHSRQRLWRRGADVQAHARI